LESFQRLQLLNKHLVASNFSKKLFFSPLFSRSILCTQLAAASDKVYQLLAHGRWFSSDTPASSTTKTGRHDIAEILLKVALKHQKSINQINKIDRENSGEKNSFLEKFEATKCLFRSCNL
jgi:hypothetical protein